MFGTGPLILEDCREDKGGRSGRLDVFEIREVKLVVVNLYSRNKWPKRCREVRTGEERACAPQPRAEQGVPIADDLSLADGEDLDGDGVMSAWVDGIFLGVMWVFLPRSLTCAL